MTDQSASSAEGRILLVDDEVLVRHELAEYLRHCGYHVIEAASTDEARIVLARLGGCVGVLLCRVEAAGSLTAFDLARLVRSDHPDVAVLMAGNIDKAAAVAGDLCDDGPDLARPYDPTIVIDRIRQRLAARERRRP